MKIYTKVRKELNQMNRTERYELNLAMRRHANNFHRDKSDTRRPLAQALTKHFQDIDSAIAAFHLLKHRLSEQGITCLPTDYGIMVLSKDIDDALKTASKPPFSG